MPTKTIIGTPTSVNTLIGGIPTVHYFDLFSRGSGQVIRLLFLDAGIAFTDVRYTFPEFYSEIKPAFLSPQGPSLNPAGTLPVVELEGEPPMTQSYAILRHFSRVLGNKYDGDTEEEIFFVDRICDLVGDWRTKAVAAYTSPNQKEDYGKYCEQVRPVYVNALERLMSGSAFAKGGPYVIGGKFTYADMALFQILHDEELGKGDMEGLKDFPRLRTFVEAVRDRPNIKAFLTSEEYKG